MSEKIYKRIYKNSHNMRTHRICYDNSGDIIQLIYNEITNFELNKPYSIQKNKIESNTEHYLYEIVKKQFDSLTDESYLEFYFVDINSGNNDFELYKYENRQRIDKIYEIPVHTELIFLDNSSNNLLLVTNVTNEKYKYKTFSNETDIFLFRPQRGYQVEFDGDKCYGKVNIECQGCISSYALVLNVYEKTPNVVYLKNIKSVKQSVKQVNKLNFTMELQKGSKIDNDELFTDQFFENLLYKKEIPRNILEEFSKTKLQTNISKKIEKQEFKINNYKDDLQSIDKTVINRFIQRFLYKSFYSEQVCNFILDQYKMSKNEICVIDKLSQIFPFIINSFALLTTFFTESYGLSCSINIKSACIYPSRFIPELSDFLCLVFLDGGCLMKFEDGTQHKLKKGDFIIFNSKTKYKIEQECIILVLEIGVL